MRPFALLALAMTVSRDERLGNSRRAVSSGTGRTPFLVACL